MNAVGVDPYIDFKGRGKQAAYDCYQQRARENLADYLDTGRLTLEVMNSQDYLCQAIVNEVERFDLIYVDGDHTAASAMVDMLLGWKMLNPGGLMLLDDTNRRWNQGRPGTAESTLAFLATLEDRWFSEYRIPDHVLTPKAWCIRKRKDRGWL